MFGVYLWKGRPYVDFTRANAKMIFDLFDKCASKCPLSVCLSVCHADPAGIRLLLHNGVYHRDHREGQSLVIVLYCLNSDLTCVLVLF